MSKIMLAVTRRGEADSYGAFFSKVLVVLPFIAAKQIRARIYGRLKYVHVDCPEHIQVNLTARKSEKLVQETISAQEVR